MITHQKQEHIFSFLVSSALYRSVQNQLMG